MQRPSTDRGEAGRARLFGQRHFGGKGAQDLRIHQGKSGVSLHSHYTIDMAGERAGHSKPRERANPHHTGTMTRRDDAANGTKGLPRRKKPMRITVQEDTWDATPTELTEVSAYLLIARDPRTGSVSMAHGTQSELANLAAAMLVTLREKLGPENLEAVIAFAQRSPALTKPL